MIRCRLLLALVVLLLPAGAAAQVTQTVLFPGLTGQPLLDAVRAQYRPAATLGYDVARDSLFAREQRLYGALTCVYTGFSVVLTPGADPSTDAFNKGINTEHTYPQSMGAVVEPSKSDMHHLFPVRDNVNSARNNHPYGEIPDAETDGWYRLDQSQSTIPTVAIDEWSELDNAEPEPALPRPASSRARTTPATPPAPCSTTARCTPSASRRPAPTSSSRRSGRRCSQWAREDRVDAREYDRMEWIAAASRETENPFVLDSTLARRAFFQRVDAGGGAPPAYSSIVLLNEIHYEQVGTDTGEFVEVAVPAGIDPASVTLTLYNGNGGVVYGTEAHGGHVRAGRHRFGGYRLYTLTFPTNGLQNGAPDGLALSVDGEIAQFLSYEGAFDATAGIATGRTSLDIGVMESDATPAGQSLQLRGTGNAYADFWAAAALTPGANTGQLRRTALYGVQTLADAAGYRLLRRAGAGGDRRRTAAVNLVQGVPAGGGDSQAQYPQAAPNLFTAYGDPGARQPTCPPRRRGRCSSPAVAFSGSSSTRTSRRAAPWRAAARAGATRSRRGSWPQRARRKRRR